MIYRFSIDPGAESIDDRRDFPAGESIGNLSTECRNLSTGRISIRKAIVNPAAVIVSNNASDTP